MLEAARWAIALIGSTIAGLWDLKTTDIPDPVCVGMIALALLLAYFDGSMSITLMAGSLALAFSLAMYFAGQWGGGDGELLVANIMLLASIDESLALGFFVNLFLIGAVYSIVYCVVYAKINGKKLNLTSLEDIFVSRIPTKNLKPGDMLGEDIPKLGLKKIHIRGLTMEEVKRIKKSKKFVFIREGVRFGPVFALAGIATYFCGNLMFYFLSALL